MAQGLFNSPAQSAAAQHFHTVKFSGWTQGQTICEGPPRIYPNLPPESFLLVERYFILVRSHLNEVTRIRKNFEIHFAQKLYGYLT